MSARTITAACVGSVGLGDSSCTFVERAISCSFDFGKQAVAEGSVIPLFQIPAGFVAERVTVVQTKATDQDFNLVIGLKSDDSVTIATAALKDLSAGETLAVVSASAGASGAVRAFASDDVICAVLPDSLTGDAVAAGAFEVCVKGYDTYNDGIAANPLAIGTYRKSLQTVENVSGGQFPLE